MTDAPTNGWLSPKGTMYGGSLGCHAVCQERFYGHEANPGKAMEQAGWWKLSGFLASDCPRWVGVRPATLQQREYIVEWCKAWNAAKREHKHAPLINMKTATLPDFEGIQ